MIAAALSILICVPPVRCAENDPPRRLRESISLDADWAVVKKLAAVQEYLTARQWAQAVEQLTEISNQNGVSLVSVAPGRYVNVALQCQLMLASLPPEALTIYRRNVAPQARQWLEAGRRGDDASLRKLVRLAYASSEGDDAISLLAERAWDQGDLLAARRLWEQLTPPQADRVPGRTLPELRYPDPSVSAVDIAARLILCSIVGGEVDRAERELLEFRRKFEMAEGTLAGKKGPLANLLQTLLEESKTWHFPPDAQEPNTFAFSPRRTKVLPEAVDVGGPLWQVDLPAQLGQRVRQRDAGPLSYFPLTFGELTLLNTADQIFAWDLATGAPAWGTKDGVIFSLEPKSPPLGSLQGASPLVGTPRFTMTLNDGRLYAKMGSPITGRARNELRDLQSSLVCLELGRHQGRLEWAIRANEVFEGEAAWAFEGSPLVDQGLVYAVMRKTQPQTQINVVAFDAATGRLVWNRKIGTLLAPNSDSQNLLSHLLLTLGEESLFLSTSAGAVAAVDSRDGTLRWVSTYELPEADSLDANRTPTIPCVFARGLVLVVSPEAGTAMAFDSASGSLRWERKLRGALKDILGVTEEGLLIISGNGLCALDVFTGEERWKRVSNDPEDYGYGRGLLAENLIYWPLREDLLILDQRTGQPVAKKSLSVERGATGGNLSISHGCLLVAQADRLSVFCEYGTLKKRAEKEISEYPTRPEPWLWLSVDSENYGRWDLAVRQLETAESLRKKLHPRLRRASALTTAERIQRLREKQSEQARAAGRAEEAMESLKAAAVSASKPSGRLECYLRLAATAESLGRKSVAAEAWLTILAEPELAELRTESSAASKLASTRRPVRAMARHVLDELWPQQNAAFVQEFDAMAREAFHQSQSNSDGPLLEQQLQKYFKARDAPGKNLELVKDYRRQRRPSEAVVLAQRALMENTVADLRPAFREQQALALSDLEAQSLALTVWKRLSVESPDWRLKNLPDEPVAAEYVQQLERRESSGESRSPVWSRLWSRRFPAPVRIPEGTSPVTQGSSLLIESETLTSIDLPTGRTMWQHPKALPLQFAGYSTIHLVLGDEAGVTAVDPVTGRIRWQHHHETGSESKSLQPRPTGLHPRQWEMDGPRILTFEPNGTLLAREGWSGEVEWEVQSRDGRPFSAWRVASSQILVETASPPRTLCVFTPTGEAVDVSGSQFQEVWLTPPVLVGQCRGAAVLANHRVVSLGLPRLSEWNYSEAISWANADPVLLTAGSRLLLVVDGDTLVRLDPDRGTRHWSRGLSRQPMRNADRLVATSGDRVYVAADGVLRAIGLDDGHLIWETPLGEFPGPLSVQLWGEQLWIAPTKLKEGERCPVWIADAATGKLRQQLQLPAGEAGPVQSRTCGSHVVIINGCSVSVYGPAER